MKRGIECRNISFAWKENDHRQSGRVFSNLSFKIEEGDFISIIGPSGCGKSTLLHIIAGLCGIQSGVVFLNGSPVVTHSNMCGFVFQDYSLFPWLTVSRNIEFGHILNPTQKKDFSTESIIKKVGLWNDRNKFPHELSGGMQQRTAIARVLATNAEYVLMDEPFGALDYYTRLKMQDFLGKITKELKKTVVFVTHNVEEAIILSDKILLMEYCHQGELEQININLPTQRDLSTPEFNKYKNQIISFLNKQTKE
jgi:NitT/TauT family transport system ATP-binding protein